MKIDNKDNSLNPVNLYNSEQIKYHTINLLIMTKWGEVLLEKDKSNENKCWRIIEQSVDTKIPSIHKLWELINDKYNISLKEEKLIQLIWEDSVIENSIVSNVNNTKKKTLFGYPLNWDEYQSLKNHCLNLNLRFISMNIMMEEFDKNPNHFSDNTLTLFQDINTFEIINRFWLENVNQTRTLVISNIVDLFDKKDTPRLDDGLVSNIILPLPDNPAAGFDVNNVFLMGKSTIPGAYKVGEMLSLTNHLYTWRKKLSDPYYRYVKEDLDVLRKNMDIQKYKEQIESIDISDARRFVRDVLHFPLENGNILRAELGNLEEIAASRNALKFYLKHKTRLPASLIDNPLCDFNDLCNQLVRESFAEKSRDFTGSDDDTIYRLLILNVLLNALDFHNPDFHNSWSTRESILDLIEHQFDAVSNSYFSSLLGGRQFLNEFLETIINKDIKKPIFMVYFTDNNGQVVISLKCIEAFLNRNPNLNIILVPKSGQHGNDASWEDIDKLMKIDKKSNNPILGQLNKYFYSDRIQICHHGPTMQGLHPGRMSKELCFHLRNADAIFAEGQAYAEIKGWLKPTYLLFQVKGRVAEAIHGVCRKHKALVFIRVGMGAIHFAQINKVSNRKITDQKFKTTFNAYGQTTVDYIKTIISKNYEILRDIIFNGREKVLLQKLREESIQTGKSIEKIVTGTEIPTLNEVEKYRKEYFPEVFAIGGGGGFNQVTLKSLQMLNVNVVAGVPSTDDGGSTGKLQKMISKKFGYMFGVGDAAAILEQQVFDSAKHPILSYRPNEESNSLTKLLVKRILYETRNPTIDSHRLIDCPDYLSFICEQLNLARVIDDNFLGEKGIPGFSIKGASIRNLNILAAFFLCGAINIELAAKKSNRATNQENAKKAWYFLEKTYGLAPDLGKSIQTIPVSYDKALIQATYSKVISPSEIERLSIPRDALSEDKKTVSGQQYIDQIIPTDKIIDFGIKALSKGYEPFPNNYYVEKLKSTKLFVMGAGSLFGSQLAQLAIPTVMDILIKSKDIRKVLIINHVCLNETMFYTLTDHIKAIERLAKYVVDDEYKTVLDRSIQIGDIFTDIVIPRTVAREIDIAIRKEKKSRKKIKNNQYMKFSKPTNELVFVDLEGNKTNNKQGIFLNHYVAYVLENPEFRSKHQITDWELKILSYLDQPPSLYKSRSEAGRYRGAVYALDEDIEYLVSHGISKRNIYEVESIAMNSKILKAEGEPQLEEFPGLIPEALVGIFKILLAKGAS